MGHSLAIQIGPGVTRARSRRLIVPVELCSDAMGWGRSSSTPCRRHRRVETPPTVGGVRQVELERATRGNQVRRCRCACGSRQLGGVAPAHVVVARGGTEATVGCGIAAGRDAGRRGKDNGKKKIKEMVGPNFWRGIWRDPKNVGLFRGLARVDFLYQTSKFWSRGPFRKPHWSCSNHRPERGSQPG
jgi:hypothetical protein